MTIEPLRQQLTILFEFYKDVEDRRTPMDIYVAKHDWVIRLDSIPVHKKLKMLKRRTENGEDYRSMCDLSSPRRS